MPIEVKSMSEVELAPAFARRPRGPENVNDYIEILESQKVTVGTGLSVRTQLVRDQDGEEFSILAGSVDDEEPGGINMRTAKRRFGMAAKALGFSLDWREVEGWLIMKGVELKAEEPEANGKAK